jgi:hypothetical protein
MAVAFEVADFASDYNIPPAVPVFATGAIDCDLDINWRRYQ